MAKAATKPVAKKPASKEVVLKKTPGALATSDSALFAAHSGAGLENVTAKDILVPRVGIIQGLSPQMVKNKAEYNPDARVGDIYDIGMGERIGDEMLFLPIVYSKVYLEWFPRSSGKGLARIHADDAILSATKPDEKGKPILPNGNYVAEIAQFYGLNMTMGNRLCFIPMGSTQLKKARQWLTLATGEKIEDGDGGEFVPPLFYRAYRLTTQPESNAEGDWVGWRIERGPALPEMEDWKDLYQSLLATHSQLSSGKMKADMAGFDEGANGGSGDNKAM